MTERSYFWTSTGGGHAVATGITQSHMMDGFFRALLNGTGNRGVLRGWRNELEVTGSSNSVQVATGGAVCYGMFYENDAAVTVNIPAATSGTTRTDLIVVRRSWGAKTCRILRIAGPSAALVQSAGTSWDVPLASVLVTDTGLLTVTDTRECCTFGTDFPAGLIGADQFKAGAVTPAKIANRSRYEFIGAGDLAADGSYPVTWASQGAGEYDCWETGTTTQYAVWGVIVPPTGIVGTADFYVWNAPEVDGSRAGTEYVRWVISIYPIQEGIEPTPIVYIAETMVDQQWRWADRFYADRLSQGVTVSAGDGLRIKVERWVIHPSPSSSPSSSESPSQSASASASSSQSSSLSPSASASPSPSASLSPSSSVSASPSLSLSPSSSASASPSRSLSPSSSVSPSSSASASLSASPPPVDTYSGKMKILGFEMRFTSDC